jgi:hypothetical protein
MLAYYGNLSRFTISACSHKYKKCYNVLSLANTKAIDCTNPY